MNRLDIVTVFHNETNFAQHKDLLKAIERHEPDGGFGFFAVDNRQDNRGFAGGCNLGAFHPLATAPVIGFLNPDCVVNGPFIDLVSETIADGSQVVITGSRFGKPKSELILWGVTDWVCGAALFVHRPWFTSVGGFDGQFTWSWEETDLIRQAQRDERVCRSIELPISHNSPDENSATDADYKRFHFERGARRFSAKWGAPRRRSR